MAAPEACSPLGEWSAGFACSPHHCVFPEYMAAPAARSPSGVPCGGSTDVLQWLRTNHVPHVLEWLLQDLLASRPADPLSHMQNALARLPTGALGASHAGALSNTHGLPGISSSSSIAQSPAEPDPEPTASHTDGARTPPGPKSDSNGTGREPQPMAAVKPGFRTFRAERFCLEGLAFPSLKEWLLDLPSKDPKRRFGHAQMRRLVATLEAGVAAMPKRFDPERVLSRVEEANAKDQRGVPEKLKAEVRALPAFSTPDSHAFTLRAYTAELYLDGGGGRSAPYQIYGEFNRICRGYGQALAPPADLLQDWELFKPLAWHLDAAIRQLPSVPMVLYRGGGYAVEDGDYRIGARGSWGGVLSASSDRRQAAMFVAKEGMARAVSGCYWMILSDQARPMYQLSEFAEEMEYVHPLDLELEVPCPPLRALLEGEECNWVNSRAVVERSQGM